MPCWLCTTGSPSCSSLRSLINASTSLTCSCFLRRRVPGWLAKSSVSVTKSMPLGALPGCTHAKPLAKAAVARPMGAGLAWKSAKDSNSGGLRPLARKKSSKVARRPSLSASSSARRGLRARCALRRSSGSSAARWAARSGSGSKALEPVGLVGLVAAAGAGLVPGRPPGLDGLDGSVRLLGLVGSLGGRSATWGSALAAR